MEPVEEPVTNTPNAPTPSRTIRVTHEGDYSMSINHGVTQAENGRRFLVFASIDDAVQAYQELKDGNVRASYLTYSLFVKSQEEMTVETLNSQVSSLVPEVHVTYSRVDDNLHTGKVVVDLLTDYQTIKAASTDNLRFFHFDPKRVRPARQTSGQGDAPQNQWSQVRPRGPRVPRDSQQGDGQQRGPRDGQQRGPRDGQQRGPRDGQQRGPRDGQQRGPRDGQQRGPRDGQQRGPRQGRGSNTNAV